MKALGGRRGSLNCTTRQTPTRASVAILVSRGSTLAGEPSVALRGPMKSTPGARIEVPTRSKFTCSFQASAVCTPWLTAAKLDLHGYTPL